MQFPLQQVKPVWQSAFTAHAVLQAFSAQAKLFAHVWAGGVEQTPLAQVAAPTIWLVPEQLAGPHARAPWGAPEEMAVQLPSEPETSQAMHAELHAELQQ
jgi:hypothetical protein